MPGCGATRGPRVQPPPELCTLEAVLASASAAERITVCHSWGVALAGYHRTHGGHGELWASSAVAERLSAFRWRVTIGPSAAEQRTASASEEQDLTVVWQRLQAQAWTMAGHSRTAHSRTAHSKTAHSKTARACLRAFAAGYRLAGGTAVLRMCRPLAPVTSEAA
jgi:hypothetical protein